MVGSVFMGLSLALTSFFVKKGLHGMQSLVVTGICVLNTGYSLLISSVYENPFDSLDVIRVLCHKY